jgi:metallo-beta-lactamase family protein
LASHSACLCLSFVCFFADFLITESTYGESPASAVGAREEEAGESGESHGAAWGPYCDSGLCRWEDAQVVLLLHELIDEKAIPDIPIFVDSPLAVNVTDVFRKHDGEA